MSKVSPNNSQHTSTMAAAAGGDSGSGSGQRAAGNLGIGMGMGVEVSRLKLLERLCMQRFGVDAMGWLDYTQCSPCYSAG